MSPVRRALVTGASGFVGGHLLAALAAAGAEIIALARPTSALAEGIARVECADWTARGIAAALGGRGFEVAYHLAAYGVRPADRDPAEMFAANVALPAALVRVCAGAGAGLVMVGSNAEYRAPVAQVPVAEDAALETAKLYGTSKAAGGLFAGALAADLGVAMRLLRLVNTYGPGEAAHRLLPHLVRHLAAPGPVPLSAGTQVRDFVYVGDAVEALRMAGEHILSEARAPNAVWNVCSGRGATVRDFALTTAAALKASAARLRFGEQAMRPDEVPWLVCDGTRIAAELGWRPRHDLGQGIAASLKAMGAT